MWRWVTRGLVLSLVALFAPLLFAQTAPFLADIDSPAATSTQSGMIVVKGWVLDPNQLSELHLYVDDQFQHKAIIFLPYIDVIESHPDWPGIHNARPGFITGFSANRFTNGPHTIEMRALSSNGDVNVFGRRTITIDNTRNQAPFGFLDIPDASAVHNVSGSFPAVGWAADLDGIQRVEVLIDDAIIQSAMYGDPRPDVAGTFPDFPGAQFSGWVANINTTRFRNGVYTLTVRAIDTLGMSNLIGRRTVQIINNDSFLRPFGYIDEPQRNAVVYGTNCGEGQGPGPISPPFTPGEHITPVRGWALDLATREEMGGVAYVELLIDGVRWYSTDNCGVVAGRYANCYGLPRYDVGRYYPLFPDAPRAGFFFTMDVGALMNIGLARGPHRLSVRVGDVQGTTAELPGRDGVNVFFECADDEDFDFAGIGHIEFPQRADYVGGDVLFRGWALEDQAQIVSVEVLVDNNFVGLAQYGFPRPDVGDLYPHILNSDNSGWSFSMDTRLLANSKHTLTVRTVDSGGRRSEIGTVDFYVANNNPQPVFDAGDVLGVFGKN